MAEVSIDSCKKEVLIGYIGILYRKFKERFPNEPINFTEVKHGEWCEFMKDPINQRNYGGQTGYYECSNCKFVEDYRPNFCPNCGADMRKDGER